MPLLRREVYEGLLNCHRQTQAACTFLTGTSELSLPYGRILRDGAGEFVRVVEDKDCTPEQRQIRELNVGIYCFDGHLLSGALDPAQQRQRPARVLPHRCAGRFCAGTAAKSLCISASLANRSSASTPPISSRSPSSICAGAKTAKMPSGLAGGHFLYPKSMGANLFQ